MEDTVKTPESEEVRPSGVSIEEAIKNFDPNDKNKALLILVNATKLGQAKGIYTLEEAELISRAIRAFVVPQSEGPRPTSAA